MGLCVISVFTVVWLYMCVACRVLFKLLLETFLRTAIGFWTCSVAQSFIMASACNLNASVSASVAGGTSSVFARPTASSLPEPRGRPVALGPAELVMEPQVSIAHAPYGEVSLVAAGEPEAPPAQDQLEPPVFYSRSEIVTRAMAASGLKKTVINNVLKSIFDDVAHNVVNFNASPCGHLDLQLQYVPSQPGYMKVTKGRKVRVWRKPAYRTKTWTCTRGFYDSMAAKRNDMALRKLKAANAKRGLD